MKAISIAHSPDADDIFMYYAIKFGWVQPKGVAFTNTALDIETLNVEALKGTYDISAISFGMYPKIRKEYALLKTAVSFGEGYGPKIIKLKGKILKPHMKVALSGANTTNALLFKVAYPKAKLVYMDFLEIEDAVTSGSVDAGVLIHESILTFNDKLEVERELWDIWLELSGGGLPLPLGGMALRRSIPLTSAISYEQTLIDAVRVADNNRKILADMLVARDLVRIDGATLDKYLDLYANKDSVLLSDLQYDAIDKLFELGFKHGFFDAEIKARDYIIPDEYNQARYS